MSPTHLEPTTAMRLRLAAVVLAGIAFNLTFDFWWDPLMTHVQSLATCDSLAWLRGMAIAFTVLFLGVAWLLADVARQISTSGQVPPPNAWVWSRTFIRRGWYARCSAYLSYFMAALFLSAPLVAGYALKVNIIFCIPESCGC